MWNRRSSWCFLQVQDVTSSRPLPGIRSPSKARPQLMLGERMLVIDTQINDRRAGATKRTGIRSCSLMPARRPAGLRLGARSVSSFVLSPLFAAKRVMLR